MSDTITDSTSNTRTNRRHPDAAIITACKAFDRLEGEHRQLLPIADVVCLKDAANGEVVDATASMERIEAEQEAYVETIVSVRATTNEGQVARARSLVEWDKLVLSTFASGDTGQRLIFAIIRDLISLPGERSTAPDRE